MTHDGGALCTTRVGRKRADPVAEPGDARGVSEGRRMRAAERTGLASGGRAGDVSRSERGVAPGTAPPTGGTVAGPVGVVRGALPAQPPGAAAGPEEQLPVREGSRDGGRGGGLLRRTGLASRGRATAPPGRRRRASALEPRSEDVDLRAPLRAHGRAARPCLSTQSSEDGLPEVPASTAAESPAVVREAQGADEDTTAHSGQVKKNKGEEGIDLRQGYVMCNSIDESIVKTLFIETSRNLHRSARS